ncbi:MAG: hypothetical protein AAGF73_06985 [Actinomycetota bacterium]
MNLDPTDRRRIVAVSALSVLALPALFLAAGSDDGSPNVATAGVEIGASNDDGPAPIPAGTSALTPDTSGVANEPVYMGGPQAAGRGVPRVAIPAEQSGTRVSASATYTSDLLDRNRCNVSEGVTTGDRLTVVNLANNRTVQCTAVLSPVGGGNGVNVLMHRELYMQLGSVTDAPIYVELRT